MRQLIADAPAVPGLRSPRAGNDVDESLLLEADASLVGWHDAATRLRNAIENDEFELFCQPFLALGAGGGFPIGEILVRLREEERTLLPPGDFLHVLEHYRMMPLLDRWVVRNAIRHLAEGSIIGCYSLNVSGQTLEDDEFPGYVAARLGASRVPPGALAFEIDEADTLLRPECAARLAAALRDIGVRSMIDSFGQRSVSFTALRSIGAAFVKVDGGIVRNLLTSGVARAKMKAVQHVGAALGFALVAECVESSDVLAHLRGLGVEFAQGFGIHRPQPIASFADLQGGATGAPSVL